MHPIRPCLRRKRISQKRKGRHHCRTDHNRSVDNENAQTLSGFVPVSMEKLHISVEIVVQQNSSIRWDDSKQVIGSEAIPTLLRPESHCA